MCSKDKRGYFMENYEIKSTEPISLLAILNYKNGYTAEVGLNCNEKHGVLADNSNYINIQSNKAFLNNVNSIDIYAYAPTRLNKTDGEVFIEQVFGDTIDVMSFLHEEEATDCCLLYTVDLKNSRIISSGRFITLSELRDKLTE